jgi:nitrite reductase (NO-forming)
MENRPRSGREPEEVAMKTWTILLRACTAGLLVTAAACGTDAPDGAGARAGVAVATGAAVAPSGAITPGDTVEFVATEFAFAPADLRAEPGTYTGTLVNAGAIEHDIVFGDGAPIVAAAGETVELEFEVPEEGIRYYCSIPGHEDAGMVGMITTAATPPADASGGGHGAGEPVAASVEADPDAPPYEYRDPRAPARGEGEGITLIPGGAPDGGDLIEVEMVIEEKLATVAEGFVQQIWTFNGTMPGPVIRTEVGDTVRVRLVNPPEAEVSHSIDFHASQVAWNDEMRSIAPGEELVYEFTTDYAGVWMYHCGTDPVLHHIANGMFGMVIVEPEGGLAPVENEFFVVQHEWYLGPQGKVSSYAAANQGAPAPDLVMFNGAAFQYAETPIEVPTGEKVRFFVLVAGPSIDSSFHVVGTIFDTVVKEGMQLVEGNPGKWGAQAVDLAPAQGAVIEFTTMEDGLYPMVTHAFNFPGRGAVGLVQAGDGEP